ncbi:hypothetical protein BC830DRAFT_955282 [Chytriomyces sp. MP71]|nr:hypothetical protein BC830DRAFT_955282 [Chytriomyces sp. MP71]
MGYLVRSGPTHDDDPTRPPYEISIEGDSTLQSVVKIACCESEGFLSLFNGHLIAWLHDITHALFLQPTIEQSLIDAFNINDDSIPLVHLENPYPPLASLVASHAISNFLLTPLDLVRTRIMVQTGNPYHRKYKSGLTALGQIVREEGIGALYASRRFFPTLLLSTLQPLFKYASPVFITHVMGVDADYQPWLFRAAELAMGVAELLVVLPLETVVRRLECQVVGRFVRGGGGSFVGVDGLVGSDGDEGQGPVRNTGSGAFEGMVRTNAIPYTGGGRSRRIRMIHTRGAGEGRRGAKVGLAGPQKGGRAATRRGADGLRQ